ncbi:hypothetical protein [Streptomyces sp. MMG1533]|uniref:hypothetical protein n=1 Tax=Streptomyces sp. MMG1533 TaxID=1415546 RepID=UPI0006AD8F8E|nr:hypothetical protein [Streptomyces sp. MMG1533]
MQHSFDHYRTIPIPPSKFGGTLTSVQAVQRRVGPAGTDRLPATALDTVLPPSPVACQGHTFLKTLASRASRGRIRRPGHPAPAAAP